MARTGLTFDNVLKRLGDFKIKCSDYYVPMNMLTYGVGVHGDFLEVGGEEIGFSPLGRAQLCRFIKPGLGQIFGDCSEMNRMNLFNQFLPEAIEGQPNKEIFVRSHDNLIRGCLSNSYGVFDDFKLVQLVKNVLGEKAKEARVTSFSKDDGRGHMNVSFIWDNDNIELGKLDDGKPDIAKRGISISNSELGLGSVRIEPMLYRLICSNGMVRAMASQANLMRHFGDPKKLEKKIGGIIWNLDKLYIDMVNKVKAAREARITKIEVQKFIRETARYFHVSDKTDKIIEAWHKEEGDDKFAVANAFTRAAHESFEGRDKYDLEVVGNKIVDMDITRMLKQIEDADKAKDARKKESEEIKIWSESYALVQ